MNGLRTMLSPILQYNGERSWNVYVERTGTLSEGGFVVWKETEYPFYLRWSSPLVSSVQVDNGSGTWLTVRHTGPTGMWSQLKTSGASQKRSRECFDGQSVSAFKLAEEKTSILPPGETLLEARNLR
jgi:hypothetical protein